MRLTNREIEALFAGRKQRREPKARSQSLSSDDWSEVVRVMRRGTRSVDIVVEPLVIGRSCWWGLVAVVDGAQRLELGKCRHQKNERKVWKHFETLCAFLERELGQVKAIRILMDHKDTQQNANA